jgi:colanic acid biosynthesis glycosyl transferase WcaI
LVQRAASHLIFLNRFFHPDHSATSQMLSDLAFALAGRGYQVSVITGRQAYDAPSVRLPKWESIAGVDVHRVPTSRFGRYSVPGRLVDYLTFFVSAAWTLWHLARRGNIIVAKTDPPMLSVIAAPIARLRGARYVNWLQDLFPEVAEELGVGGALARAVYRPLRWLRDRSLRNAEVNVVVGERMARALVGRGINSSRIRTIPNWADGDLIRPVDRSTNALRRQWRLGEAFTVGYAGNLGRAHEIETMLAAIAGTQTEQAATERTVSSQAIRWVFIGGGAQFGALQAAVVRRRLGNVVFQGYQPRERLAESLSVSDVHLISLRPELEGFIVPSKFYGITAAGRPTIFIGDPDGEIPRLLKKYECGFAVAQGDAAGLVQVVMKLAGDPSLLHKMGENARRAFDNEFNKSSAVARWDKLLLEFMESSIAPIPAMRLG